MSFAPSRRGAVALATSLGLLLVAQAPVRPVAADGSVVASASNGSAAARASISIKRPKGAAPGNVLVAAIAGSGDTGAFIAPPGWILVRQDRVSGVLRHAAYLKIAGPAEPGSYVWKAGGSHRLAGGITAFAGLDTAQPVDAVDGSVNPSGKAVAAPDVTTTLPGDLIVHIAAVAAEGDVKAPAGMAEQWQAASFQKSGKGDVLVSLSESTQTAAGPTGARSATATKAGKSVGVTLALRAAGVVADPPPDPGPRPTTIDSGPSGTTTGTQATFTFSADPAPAFACQLDGGEPEPCSSPVTYVGLADGGHTFTVTGTPVDPGDEGTGDGDGASPDPGPGLDPSQATRSWMVDSTAADPVMVGAGDIAYCGNDNDEATAELLDQIPGTVFTLGDNVYPDGSLQDYLKCYGPTWGRHQARTIPVVGNHEYVGSAGQGYFGYFGAAAGDPTKGYYDLTLGAWHVIVLNAACDDVGGCGPGSPEEQWLRQVLADADADCTIALWHNARFSSGTVHGSDAAYQPFWQALSDYGADVVLNGHDHDYERFGLQTPSGASDAVYGLREFVVGTGGRSSYRFGNPLPNSDVRGSAYGVLKLTLHDASYDWQFVPVAGQTFTDQGSSACHGAPRP